MTQSLRKEAVPCTVPPDTAAGCAAQAHRRQKLQARVMLAAMELRVARLQERLAALRKQDARGRYAAPEQ